MSTLGGGGETKNNRLPIVVPWPIVVQCIAKYELIYLFLGSGVDCFEILRRKIGFFHIKKLS
jgi:hypothetical protein